MGINIVIRQSSYNHALEYCNDVIKGDCGLEMYIAMIGDIVGSRSLSNRDEVQKKLENILDYVNQRYSEFVVSNFLITLGDEFQGLLKPQSPIYEIICTIVEAIYPVDLRFGLGFGSITTDIKHIALGMDGPAFYNARDAINTAHRKKGHAINFKSDSIDQCDAGFINLTLDLLSTIRNQWSLKFIPLLPLLRKGNTQKEIAQLLNIAQPYVSKLCSSAHWSDIREAERNLDLLLKQCLPKFKERKAANL